MKKSFLNWRLKIHGRELRRCLRGQGTSYVSMRTWDPYTLCKNWKPQCVSVRSILQRWRKEGPQKLVCQEACHTSRSYSVANKRHHLQQGGRRGPRSEVVCSLSPTCVPWHACPLVHTHAHMCTHHSHRSQCIHIKIHDRYVYFERVRLY